MFQNIPLFCLESANVITFFRFTTHSHKKSKIISTSPDYRLIRLSEDYTLLAWLSCKHTNPLFLLGIQWDTTDGRLRQFFDFIFRFCRSVPMCIDKSWISLHQCFKFFPGIDLL